MPPAPTAAGAARGTGARKPPHRTTGRARSGYAAKSGVKPVPLEDTPDTPETPDATGTGFTDPAGDVVPESKPTPDTDARPSRRARARKSFDGATDRVSKFDGGPDVPKTVPIVGGQDSAGAVLGILFVAFLINVLKGTSSAWLKAKFLNETSGAKAAPSGNAVPDGQKGTLKQNALSASPDQAGRPDQANPQPSIHRTLASLPAVSA